MRRAALLLLLCGAVGAVMAQEKTDPSPAKPTESPLVRAARASGGKKRKPTGKVITNKDVKKSRGKLIVLPPKPGQETTKDAAPAADSTIGPLEAYDQQLKAQQAAHDRVAAAEKKVSELQRELRRLEDAYYAENDPNYRDKTIAPEFGQVKRQLDTAEKALADARDAQEKLKPGS